MTEEDIAERNHFLVRRMATNLGKKYFEKGVLPVDIAIGLTYAALDHAAAMHGDDQHAAVEWMRSTLNEFERSMLEQQSAKRTQ